MVGGEIAGKLQNSKPNEVEKNVFKSLSGMYYMCIYVIVRNIFVRASEAVCEGQKACMLYTHFGCICWVVLGVWAG